MGIHFQVPQINQEMLTMGIRHNSTGGNFVQRERNNSTVNQDVCAEVDEDIARNVHKNHHIASAIATEEFVTATHGEEESAVKIH